ncbi:hypothetical protein INQ51_16960 [Maribellus sp. CM-23]|uniref:hypothetical protein n=1 Tax=Maribellus sp. CM-23 TaxID=2781026 RepID=UPI001F389CDE|nr:hypothetical protein [Maribellus sp. CM-23]MCE4566012.1 hypothetical protein [Maribellus sp. CM-23]
MDDLIVIILTILVAVVGALNQRKKKREAEASASEEAGQPTDFWEMIMQQEERPPVYQTVPQEEDDLYDEVVDTVPEPKPVYQFKAEAEGSSEVVGEKKILQREAKKRVMVDGEEFSIRKAIIYSEIMNRKYI